MEQSITGDMVLGSQSIVRVLIISSSPDQSLGAGQDIFHLLGALGHQVSVVGLDTWREVLAPHPPEVVLIDGPATLNAAGLEGTAKLCREIKNAPECHDVSLAVVAPDIEHSEVANSLEILHAAGADDLWAADATATELQVRLELLSRLCRLARDLSGARTQLSKHLLIDDTSQLLTRRFFFQAAFREVSRARRYGHHLSCLMIDIDFLDNINRKFGDTCGNYVVRAVAYIVRQWTRDSDTVARFSDTKFVALLPETPIENAARVRDKIMKAMGEAKFEWHGQPLPVSVSIGEAECPLIDAEQTGEIAVPAIGEVDEDAEYEDPESHSFSVREELAGLLEDADAALSVVRKTTIRPEIFVEYSPGTVGLPGSE